MPWRPAGCDPATAVTRSAAELAENYRPPGPGDLRIAAIDDRAALATGYVRVPAGSGGHKVVSRTWLSTTLDDLVFRALALPDERTARSRYADDGVALGL